MFYYVFASFYHVRSVSFPVTLQPLISHLHHPYVTSHHPCHITSPTCHTTSPTCHTTSPSYYITSHHPDAISYHPYVTSHHLYITPYHYHITFIIQPTTTCQVSLQNIYSPTRDLIAIPVPPPIKTHQVLIICYLIKSINDIRNLLISLKNLLHYPTQRIVLHAYEIICLLWGCPTCH